MVDPGLVEPLDPYLAKGAPPWMGDFYPSILDAFRYRRNGTGERNLYALPKDFTTAGMYVNLDLFERAGLRVPYDGWTWAELAEDARKITDLRTDGNDRIFGVNFNSWTGVFEVMARSFGGRLFAPGPDGKPDYARPTFTDPGVVETLAYVRRLRLEDGTAFNATGIGRDGGNEFLTGNIGILGPGGRWFTPQYRSAPTLRFDYVPLPHKQGVEPTGTIYATGWAMSAAGKSKPEAFELLKYLCGPGGARQNAELGLAIPALQSVAESGSFLSPDKQPRNSQQFPGRHPDQPDLQRAQAEGGQPDPRQPNLGRRATRVADAPCGDGEGDEGVEQRHPIAAADGRVPARRVAADRERRRRPRRGGGRDPGLAGAQGKARQHRRGAGAGGLFVHQPVADRLLDPDAGADGLLADPGLYPLERPNARRRRRVRRLPQLRLPVQQRRQLRQKPVGHGLLRRARSPDHAGGGAGGGDP